MRIGFYNPRVGFARSGGTETFIRQIAKQLQSDHEIVFYCGEGEIIEEVLNLDVRIEQIPLISKESATNRAITGATPVIPAEVESLTMFRNARRRGIFEEMDKQVDIVSTHYYLITS
ncbi:hypothetical protein ACFQFH_15190 [Halobaculum halobium]|uniref:hypothetical protein n=1 Tax=Halobaculum halobium TaxID=3032281 RepID=UPI00361F18A7